MYQERLFFQPLLTFSRSLSDDNSLNNPEIEAVVATQHAEDDPSPTPMGISEFIVISNPLTFWIRINHFICLNKQMV